MPTAAVACVDIVPTKKVSAVLYMPVTSILTMVGKESFTMSLGTGVLVNISAFVILSEPGVKNPAYP